MRHDRHARAAALAAVLTLLFSPLLAPPVAEACGGFFCNSSAPVAQSGENILFGIEDDGTLSVHVQIFYSGPSDRFAWILPLPSVPTQIDVGTDELFLAMGARTAPVFQTAYRTDGTCREPPRCDYPDAGFWGYRQDAAAAADAGASGPIDPSVLFRGEVGPYDAVVLSAGTVDELTTWLRDNGFDIPTTADPLLADYVAARHVFVAIRLLSDRMAGEIQPIVLRYAEGQPCVPIRLTAIAATLDMPITAYFLARAHVASDNYSSVEPTYDDLRLWAYDWTGDTYRNYVSNQIDDAGGRGFVTEYAGATPTGIDLRRASPSDSPRPATPRDLLHLLEDLGFRGDPAILSMLVRFVPPPAGTADPRDYYNCLYSGSDPSTCGYVEGTMDLDGLFGAIDDQIIRPRREATEMIARHPRTTRLFTTMSPEEMTIDPTFRVDDGLPEVSNVHVATRVFECSEDYVSGDAPTHLELPSGTIADRSPGVAFTTDAEWCSRRGGWPYGTPRPPPDGGPGGGASVGGGGCAVGDASSGLATTTTILAAIAIAIARRKKTRAMGER